MNAWLEDLRPYAGEPRGSAGWRLAKASWRLVREQRTILQLVLILAALGAAQGYLVFAAGLRWHGSDVVWILILDAAQTLAAICLLGAVAANADAALDGVPFDLATARAETGGRLRPLFSWAAVFFVVWIVLLEIGRGLDSPALAILPLLAWYLATFFAIPLAVLGEMNPGSALRLSLRLLRAHWRECLAAGLGIGVFGLLAVVPGTTLLTHVAAVHQEQGHVPRLLFALALFVAFTGFGLALATKEAFAVMIVREEIDDLSPREYAGKRLGRGVKFLRFCGGVALFFAVFGISTAIDKHDRAVVKEANSPGSNYTTEVAYEGALPSGSAVVFRGRKIGEVLGSEQEGSHLRVRFHVEPGFGPTSTPGELMVEAAGGSPCLVLVPLGESPPGSPRF
jgi:hypothetical protein